MTVVQLVQCLTGLILVYISLFLYEDEEGRLQNILEKWWIDIDDHRKEYARRSLALLQHLATKVSSALDRLFGCTLLSTQAAAVSLCLLVGTIALAMVAVSMLAIWFVDLEKISLSEILASISLFFLLPLFLVYFLSRIVHHITQAPPVQWFSKVLVLFFACVVFYSVGLVVLRASEAPQSEISSDMIIFSIVSSFAVFLASYASDVFLIALSRFSFRQVTRATSIFAAVAMIVATNVGIFLISTCPLALILNKELRRLNGRELHYDTVLSIFLIVLSNSPAVLVSTLLSGLSMLMLLHRLTWPVIQRPVYMVARFELLKKKKAVCGLGIALVVFAFPDIATWLGGPLGRALLPSSIVKGLGVP